MGGWSSRVFFSNEKVMDFLELAPVNTDLTLKDAQARWKVEDDKDYAGWLLIHEDQGNTLTFEEYLKTAPQRWAIVNGQLFVMASRSSNQMSLHLGEVSAKRVGAPFSLYWGADLVNGVWKTDPLMNTKSTALSLFKVDANDVPVEVFDYSAQDFRPYSEYLNLLDLSQNALRPLLIQ